MRFTSGLLLVAAVSVLNSGSKLVKARRGDSRGRNGGLGKRAKIDRTFASCKVNLDKDTHEKDEPIGRTMFWQYV